RAGMTGFAGILEDPRGFWRRFTFVPLPVMLGDLGDVWVTQTLTIKSFPGCHYFQTALTAIARILERREIALQRVRAVRIATTKLACEVSRFAGEYVGVGEGSAGGLGLSAVGVNFDLAYSAALLLHARRLSTAELTSEYLAANGAALRAW